MSDKKAQAIDLYSGMGGWTLGCALAGVNVVSSYEWWDEANKTHNINFSTSNNNIDIRLMEPEALPKPGTIDFVLGSPPCTQFSFANRGGNGDIEDGLKDIEKFLEVITYLKPKYWAMENVPRVASVLEEELGLFGRLSRFKELVTSIIVVDMSDYGLPQGRKRMIAGNFPEAILLSYKTKTPKLTLGHVIKALAKSDVIDPNFGITIPQKQLTDNIYESPLTDEEVRMNRDAKSFHPVYNKMAFPDELDRPSRTITATCTRVSRESIIIESQTMGKLEYRRLSPRERGVLQSFPITFQFFGNSYSSKLKMIGNAFPPVMSYYVISSMLEITAKKILLPNEVAYKHPMPSTLPPPVKMEVNARKYPPARKFKAAIPGLRFGSGVRFDFSNHFINESPSWLISFFFGSSKKIRELPLNNSTLDSCFKLLKKEDLRIIESLCDKSFEHFSQINAEDIQSAWIAKKNGVSPYEIVDVVGKAVFSIRKIISNLKIDDEIAEFVYNQLSANGVISGGRKNKLVTRGVDVFSGIIVSSWINANLPLIRGTKK